MAGVDFFQGGAPDPAADPSGFAMQQRMAQALMSKGATAPQGNMVGGHYVSPDPMQYAAQLASAGAGGYRNAQLQHAQQGWNVLNGGTTGGTPPQMPAATSPVGDWLKGLFAGGGGA